MVYADYGYYKSKYYGTLPEDSFNSLILKASREIDENVNTRLTQTKIENLSKEAQEQLKYTACALIDLLYDRDKDSKSKVASISIDGVSKTFKATSSQDYISNKKEIINYLPDELTKYL